MAGLETEPLAKTGDRPGFLCRKPPARDGQWAGRSVCRMAVAVTAADEPETRGSWGLPAGYEGKHARREAAHFRHDPFQFAVVLDPLPVEDDLVFGEMRADSFSAGLARPVVVGTVPGVRVVVAAASGLPTRYPAGLGGCPGRETRAFAIPP